MKIWVSALFLLNFTEAYRRTHSWSSWSSWSTSPNGKRTQKYRNEYNTYNRAGGLQSRVRTSNSNTANQMQRDQAPIKNNVKCHTSCTNGNCETKCTKNGKQVSANEANYQFNYISSKNPQKLSHTRKRVQKPQPVSTSYSSCTFTCKSGQKCVKTCKGPNSNNINMDIKRTGNMNQNVHFDFKVKHKQNHPISSTGNGNGCVYPRVIVGNSCRMPAEENSRKNMCVKVKNNGRSKHMSITGLITKQNCCCGDDSNDGSKWGAKQCPRSDSNAQRNLCSKRAQSQPEEIEQVVTTEASEGCGPNTPSGSSACGADETTALPEETPQNSCGSCDSSCGPEEYNNPTTPACAGCSECGTTQSPPQTTETPEIEPANSCGDSNSPTTPGCGAAQEPEEIEPACGSNDSTTPGSCSSCGGDCEEEEPTTQPPIETTEDYGCGECDSSCGPNDGPTTPGCSGCGGDCAAPTTEPTGCDNGGCDSGCDDGGCDSGCDDGGCDSGCDDNGCDSCGDDYDCGTQQPETTAEQLTYPQTDRPETERYTDRPETDPYEPDNSGYGSGFDDDNNQRMPERQTGGCRNDEDCELPPDDYTGGADQNECSGENCGEPVAVDADCTDCQVENEDTPGGSDEENFLNNFDCQGDDCDLTPTTGIPMTSDGGNGIPGTQETGAYAADLPNDDFLYQSDNSLRRINNYAQNQQLQAVYQQVPISSQERDNRADALAAERDNEIISRENYEIFEMPINEEGICEQSNSFGEVFIVSSSSVTKEECCCAAYLNNKGSMDANEAASVNREFNQKACPLPKTLEYRRLCPAKMGVARYSYKNRSRKLKDINECDLFEACGVNGICQNFKKSYSCDCFKNYKFNPVSMKCEPTVAVKSCYIGRIDDNRQRIKIDNLIMPGFEHVSSRNMNTCGRNLGRHSKRDCCCGSAFDDLMNMPGSVDPTRGGNGKFSWGSNCKACPNRGTSAYRRLCN